MSIAAAFELTRVELFSFPPAFLILLASVLVVATLMLLAVRAGAKQEGR